MCATYAKTPTKNTRDRRIARQRDVIKQAEQNVLNTGVRYTNVQASLVAQWSSLLL